MSSLGTILQQEFLKKAVSAAQDGRHTEAAISFKQSKVLPGNQSTRSCELAYAFYRYALICQSEGDELRALENLETARQFPSLTKPLHSLLQRRLTAIKMDTADEIRRFENAIAKRFDLPATAVELINEFLERYGLSQPTRCPTIAGIDEISSVGVYRWAGDLNRNERWSQLIRQFKKGDNTLPAFFGRVLAEHVRQNPTCTAWTRELDYIVPVPANATRTAERGINIVGKIGEHLSRRLAIPIRMDFIKREDVSERARFTKKSDLHTQYRFNKKNASEIQNRTIMLLDDVMNRGYTAEVCASKLREFGCSKVVLLVLAQAESTLSSIR